MEKAAFHIRAPLRTLLSIGALLIALRGVGWFSSGRMSAASGGGASAHPSAVLVLAALGALIIVLARFWRLRLRLLPVFTNTKEKRLYVVCTGITLLLLFLSGGKTAQPLSLSSAVGFVYAALLVPAFEELLFRGYVWARLVKAFSPEITVCMLSALLYALWNAVGVNALLPVNTLNAMDLVMSVGGHAVVGLMLGLTTGFARLLSKNCVPGLLIHILLAAMLR